MIPIWLINKIRERDVLEISENDAKIIIGMLTIMIVCSFVCIGIVFIRYQDQKNKNTESQILKDQEYEVRHQKTLRNIKCLENRINNPSPDNPPCDL